LLGLYLNNPGELELKEFSVNPSIRDYEVRIRLIYGGICGSDIGVFKGKIGHAKYPIRPGHELVGRIIEVGNKVDLEIGKKVVITPNTFCGKCENCKRGNRNICSFKESLGVNVDGIFSEEITISSKYVLPIPEDLQDEKAVLIEPFAVIAHAFEKVRISKGTTVAIIGCGTEGMLAIALATFLGAEVTAIDVNPSKLEIVKSSFGVNTVLADKVEDGNFDVVIEAAGVNKAVEQAVQVVGQGGTIILIGLSPEATLPIIQLVRNEITIHGSIIYNFPNDFTTCVDFLRNDRFNVTPIISSIFPLREYQKAYSCAVSGQYGKVLLDFNSNP
jgi:L-iditol 2-dehydrogenase